MPSSVPFLPRIAARGMVCAADQLASAAGVTMLGAGGSAADAIVGAAAVMAVVGPHLCGLGGDALAMVRAPGRRPEGLLGIGRAGSGADPDRLRADGHDDMPLRGDIRSVPVPGAVDGWLALHARYGRLPWAHVLEPAVALAEEGFAASLMLVFASTLVRDVRGAEDLCPPGGLDVGHLVRRPGLARTLRALAAEGRDGFYGGEFGRALVALGRGEYGPEDLGAPLAQWVEPLALRALGHDLWTVPPPSQGYLSLAATWVAEQVGLPTDPADPRWAHVVAEASRVTGEDRPRVLHDGADGPALLSPARREAWVASVDRDGSTPSASASRLAGRSEGARHAGLSDDGDTTHLCAADADGLAISLTQSNALDFGAHIVAGDTGVFLHNRGVGFSLEPGHPAQYGPRRRPTHTLSPAIATRPDGSATHVLGAMGGDVQPQVVMQLLTRLLHSGEDAATAIAAARVVHEAPGAPPFRLWQAPARALVMEAHAPDAWKAGLEARGHTVRVIGALNPVDVGCAQIISVTHAGDHVTLTGASDPRSPDGGAVGH